MTNCRTTCLDHDAPAPDPQPEPSVTVLHHQPDFENLQDKLLPRLNRILEEEAPCYLYANPIVTISCEKPTPEFFTKARKHQSQWCQRFRKVLGRRALRKVQDWTLVNTIPDEHQMPRKHRKFMKFMNRSLCFTGLLFIEGKAVPSDQWPDHNNRTKK